MKRLILIFILSVTMVSCSDETTNTDEILENPKIYAYNNSSRKIVELNADDGSEIRIVAENIFDDSNIDFTNVAYLKSTNEIIGTIIVPLGGPSNFDYYYVRINVINGQVFLNLIDYQYYQGFTISNEGKLYAYDRHPNVRKIVELDPSNGLELNIIVDLEALNENNFRRNLMFSEITNELVGTQSLINPPNYYYWLTRINPSNGILTQTPIENYDSMVMSDNGNIYAYSAYNGKIVELDLIDGSEIRVITEFENKIFRHINYSEITNELISIVHTPGVSNNLGKINLDNGNITEIDLSESGWDYDFILLNQ